MSLTDLPEELLAEIVEWLKRTDAAAPEAGPTSFYNWIDQSSRHAACAQAVSADLLSLARTCRRLYALAQPHAHETVSARRWMRGRIDNCAGDKTAAAAVYDEAVRCVYAGALADIPRLGGFPNVHTVILKNLWDYSALQYQYQDDDTKANGEHDQEKGAHGRRPPRYAGVRTLRCVNCSLGLSALCELHAAFPNLSALWYEHGVYETLLGEPRRFWSSRNFSEALSAQRHTLRTLVLTRDPDALAKGHRQQQQWQYQQTAAHITRRAAPVPHVDLSGLPALEHVRIAEVFLFCLVQLRHHQRTGGLSDGLPASLRSLSVFYDEPREVRFEWTPPLGPLLGHHHSAGGYWPHWPGGLVEDKRRGALPLLESVTVLEKAKPQPVRWGYLDEDHDGVAPEEQPNKEAIPPPAVAHAFADAGIAIRVLSNVGRRELR